MNQLAAAKALTPPTPDPDALRAADLLLSGQADQALTVLGVPPDSPIAVCLASAARYISDLTEEMA